MNENTKNILTLAELRAALSEVRRLIVFAETKGHAKAVEAICAEHRRSVISNRWVTQTRALRMWDEARKLDAGCVLIIWVHNPSTVIGWHVEGDGAVWCGTQAAVQGDAFAAFAQARARTRQQLNEPQSQAPFFVSYFLPSQVVRRVDNPFVG